VRDVIGMLRQCAIGMITHRDLMLILIEMVLGWDMRRITITITGFTVGLLYVTERCYFTRDITNAVRCEV
jgi:hypothetical protein